MADMAHFAGLVAAEQHPSPVPYCDVVTTTTTRRSAVRGGMILCREEFAKKINSRVFPGQQGGPLMHVIAGKAVALKIAQSDLFRERQARTREGAAIVAEEMLAAGVNVLTGGTDVHLVLADLRDSELDGQQAEDRLHEIGITVNRNAVPFDPRPPAVSSGLRIGTPGARHPRPQADDFREVGRMIGEALTGDFSDDKRADLTQRTRALAERYPLYPSWRPRGGLAGAAGLRHSVSRGPAGTLRAMDELDALWAFLVAAVIAFAATPPTARFARRLGVVHAHASATCTTARPGPGRPGDPGRRGRLRADLPAGQPGDARHRGGAVAIALVGALDDARPGGLHPLVKLAGQFAAAAIPVWCDVRVENVTLPFIDPLELGDWGYPLTLVGIVAVMNVVNFTDGADGLAAGRVHDRRGHVRDHRAVADRDAAGVLAALTAGAAVGFLWHNFHPASIFMGDAGSNLLGLLLACVAIQGVLKTAAVVALFFPLLILAVPALDATFVVAKRIKYRRPVYSADRWHFHHRFANIGFSQRRTVLYLYGWTLSLAALALAMRFVPYSDDDGTLHAGWTLVIAAFALMAVAASVYLVIVLEILKFKRFRERELRRQVETGEIAALSAPRSTPRSSARWRPASSAPVHAPRPTSSRPSP